MNAVGKLGSYISRGVVTVSAPFHPFGGAVDIVVVQQEDGSYKSSPWYVQFGKFQGVLKAREKVVCINVNGVDADFRMYLDNRGGAHFLREVDGDEEMSDSICSSGGDNTDGSSCIRMAQKNMSCNYELQKPKLDSEFGASNQKKTMTRNSSTGPRVLGFVFGRRSWKENRLKHQENVVGRDREGSLERAEIAADLLEVRWSTSLATRKHRKDSTLRNSSVHDEKINEMDSCRLSPQSNGFHDKGETQIPVNYMESFTLKETYLDVDAFESLVGSNGSDIGTNSNSVKADVGSNGVVQSSTIQALQVGDERRMEKVESSLYCDTSESFMDDGLSGESSENLCLSCSVSREMDVPAEVLSDDQELISKVDSEFSSSILECKTDMNRDNLGDKDPCRSIDGSKSDSVTSSDAENVLETKVDVVVECETNESPLKYVEEMVVNQTPSPSLTNSFLIEEVTSSILDSKENLRSQKPSSSASSDLDHLGSYEESKSQDFGESSEDNVALLAKNPDNTQFFFSDFDGSEFTKTMDTHPIALDSLEAENYPQCYPKSSEEKLGESAGMLNESHSFTGRLIQEVLPDDHPSSPEMSRTVSSPIIISQVHELADQTEQTVKSLPRIWPHEADINAQGSNCLISRSLDSSFDNLRLAQGDFPTALETGEHKKQLTSRHSSMEYMQISDELRKILSDPAVEISLCRHMLYKGMGQEAAAQAFDSEKLDLEKLVYLGSEILRNDRLVVRIGGLYFPWDAALPIISAIGSPTGEQILEPKGMITVDQVENDVERDPTQSINSTIAPETQHGTAENTDTPKSASIKKMVWAKTPTSEQLTSLNLKEGRNEVTFTFSTPMLGEQKVDARIYLWKWNARIVISDVDGTITKSDVLGQFMPLVGVDWSHIGVAHLFSAIKENGYELLFLSARAISQASLTRQFLFNLKQDGKALPEGPVVISPDGLFPSLIREVIRRAPHEFKIACLEDIRALFPPHHNPFYAGFGNRDTDELSYLKVGIPKGKIFIINPKGEVAVQRRVDRKTYTSLHTLVHDMFPPPSSVSSSEQEDFNSWNFWRLPPPETVV